MIKRRAETHRTGNRKSAEKIAELEADLCRVAKAGGKGRCRPRAWDTQGGEPTDADTETRWHSAGPQDATSDHAWRATPLLSAALAVPANATRQGDDDSGLQRREPPTREIPLKHRRRRSRRSRRHAVKVGCRVRRPQTEVGCLPPHKERTAGLCSEVCNTIRMSAGR